MIRLLVDENVPSASIRLLREQGLDVLAIADRHRGRPDLEVFDLADTLERVLVTFDRDFGVLAFRDRRRCRAGVLLLRFVPRDALEAGEILSSILLDTSIVTRGYFTVVERTRLRQRKIGPAR